MPESAPSTAESSLLLWGLAAALSVLAAHVCMGWLRRAQRCLSLRDQLLPVLVAAATLGSGICASMVLALAGEALAFPLGYHAVQASLLWLGAIAAALPICLVLARSHRWWILVGSGVPIAALAGMLHLGWLDAVGFRPGLEMRYEFALIAALLMAIGSGAAIWIGLSSASRSSSRRVLWRVGASALLGLSLIAGQEVTTAGAGLASQLGSVYARELPGSILSMVAGVLLPLLLTVATLDLALNRYMRDRSQVDPEPPDPGRRRKRRHRMRAL